MSALLHVGTTKIIEIIKSINSESVKIEALQAAKTICEVKGTTIHNCTFTSKQGK